MEQDCVMHKAIQADRLWFQQNPSALIRFRPQEQDEFANLLAVGQQPPFFRPSICRKNARLSWVAVVNLMRLADSSPTEPTEPTIRVRLRVPAIRTAKRRKLAEDELLEAVADELLKAIDTDQTPVAA